MLSPHEQVQSLLGQMKDAASNPGKFEALSDQLEVLTAAYMVPTVETDNWPGVHLTKGERRVADCLFANLGRTVNRDALMNAQYFDNPNNEAENKITDVHICRMRRKLAEINSEYRIENVWGTGYRLVSTLERVDAAA